MQQMEDTPGKLSVSSLELHSNIGHSPPIQQSKELELMPGTLLMLLMGTTISWVLVPLIQLLEVVIVLTMLTIFQMGMLIL